MHLLAGLPQLPNPGGRFLPILIPMAIVGHACIWIALLNVLYSQPLSKLFLKLWRLLTAIIILAAIPIAAYHLSSEMEFHQFVVVYIYGCVFLGGVIFPLITLLRLTAEAERFKVDEYTVDYWKRLGANTIGHGFHSWAPLMPGNCVFQVEFTDLTLRPAQLPTGLDGLSILLLSDLHFHGTPSLAFFEALFADIAAGPTPDIIILAGDYVDTHTHHEWLAPLLSKLKWNEAGFAILGNHDKYHNPERVRGELTQLGYMVLNNKWNEVTIRGERVIVSGHEGPWFRPAPDISTVPKDIFHICISHSPDNFYWGVRHNINLMLCGHVHGGGIRIPIVGSIFVPSIYGRRFDQGVFQKQHTTMVVSRGISGKEPLRIRCRPQVIRITLKC